MAGLLHSEVEHDQRLVDEQIEIASVADPEMHGEAGTISSSARLSTGHQIRARLIRRHGEPGRSGGVVTV